MAVVYEKKYGAGTVRIHDDAYKDLSPEQQAKNIKKLENTLSRILNAECRFIITEATA